ncbi:hypothetical protein [Methanobacterium aggregans]|uniref:hypothetical protein n=1 Tax=Methanobacterium aggregans TaxID=1615586 RepID=UPI001AE7CCB6|nr:hypothetical protein [Methanobacterium aggregans]MBP2045853.1 hypothetical protein [Methanobacterium aggregans]
MMKIEKVKDVSGKYSENARRNQFLSSRKDKDIMELGRRILRGFGYNPQPLCPERLLDGCEGIEIGIDDILSIREIPGEDPLTFKRVKPFNEGFFSMDYRSNNFGSYDNDGHIFVKLMEFLPKKWYDKDVLLEKQSKGRDIKIKGILSKRNPDYLFFIRNTYDKPRGSILENSLINAYLLPVKSLKSQVIDNLNMIRDSNDARPLKLDNEIDSILDIYQTWQLYDKRHYDFELIRARDSNRPDLIMKIDKDNLLDYTLFNSNGEFNEI